MTQPGNGYPASMPRGAVLALVVLSAVIGVLFLMMVG